MIVCVLWYKFVYFRINPQQLRNPIRKMEAFLASTPALKDTAQRAFVAYVKSVFLMKDKSIFKVHELNTDAFSKSLGLAIPPRIRFLQRMNAKSAQKDGNQNKNNLSENKITKFEDSGDSGVSDDEAVTQNKAAFSLPDSENSDEDDDILTVKRENHDMELPTESELAQLELGKSKKKKPLTKAAIAKKMIKKNIVANKKVVFDEAGEAVIQATKEKQSQLAVDYENEDIGGIDLDKARMVLKEEDKYDKALFKEKVKAKKKEKKKKLKQKKLDEEQKDDFGTDSEDDGPDLSWLPDPDKIYGKSNREGDEDVCEENASDQEEGFSEDERPSVEVFKSKKRKGDKLGDKTKKKKKTIDESLSLNEAEELALLLLNKK